MKITKGAKNFILLKINLVLPGAKFE